MTLSPAVKIFSLCGLLAALALGAWLTLLVPGADELEPVSAASLVTAPAKAKEVAAKAEAAAAKTSGVAALAKAEAPAKAKATVKAPAKAPVSAVAANGLPRTIATALRSNPVVVVALWGTGGKIDSMARDEAAAGAAAARAGFVALNVIESQRQAEALMLQLDTVLRAPAVLIYTRPNVLHVQLDGFRDRDTVAQAALNALR